MKPYFLLLLVSVLGLTACTPVTQYIEARRTAYQHSRDLGALKMPPGFKTGSSAYVIPEIGEGRAEQAVSLYPPT